MSYKYIEGELDLDNNPITGFKRKIIALTNASGAVTRTLLAAETGALVTINPGSGTGSRTIAITLPTPAAGLFFDFLFVSDAGANTNDISWTTGDNAVDLKGILQTANYDPNAAADYSGTSQLMLSANVSKITIDVSTSSNALQVIDTTRFTCVTDGTHWYVNGTINANYAIIAPSPLLAGLVQSTTA